MGSDQTSQIGIGLRIFDSKSTGLIMWRTGICAAVVACVAFNMLNTQSPHKHLPRIHQTGQGGRKAIVVGATGATGRYVVQKLLASREWSSVTAIVRREMSLSGEEFDELKWIGLTLKKGSEKKLEQLVVEDFEQLEQKTKGRWSDSDVVFHCLGTTRAQAGGAAGFKRIEAGYSETVARIAKEEGVAHMSVVSAVGANHQQFAMDWFHPLLYIKTLGQKEQGVIKQSFLRTSIFRPGLLSRGMGDRWHESVAEQLTSALKTESLASAMIADAETAPPLSQELPVFYEDTLIRQLASDAAQHQ